MQGVNDVNSVSYFKPKKGLFKKILKGVATGGVSTIIDKRKAGSPGRQINKLQKQSNKLARIQGRKAIKAARKAPVPGYLPKQEIEEQMQVRDAAIENINEIQPVENVITPTYNEPEYNNQEELDYEEPVYDYQEEPYYEETESFMGIETNVSKKVVIIVVIVIIVLFFVFKSKK